MSATAVETQPSRRRPPISPFKNFFGAVKSLSSPLLVPESSDGSASHSNTAPTPPAVRKPSSKPNCTHIVMTRLYGNHTCYICGRISAFGWVYVCQQDAQQRQLHRRNDSNDSNASKRSSTKKLLFPVEQKKSTDSPMIVDMLELGFNKSVIDGARNGDYTPHQLKLLVWQKQHMWKILHAQEYKRNTNDGSTFSMPGAFNVTPPATPTKTKSRESSPEKANKKNSARYQVRSKEEQGPQCAVQACHGCRPYYKDRCYVSFEAVFAGEVEPLTDVDHLPLRNASLLRQIGLRVIGAISFQAIGEPLSSASVTPCSSSSSSEYELCEEPRRPSNNDFVHSPLVGSAQEGSSSPNERFKRALTTAFQESQNSTLGQSNITLPLEGTGSLREYDEDAEDFDISLFRRMDRVDNLALHLPERRSLGTINPGKPSTVEDATPDGEEVEVDGGVALTEEAVETHTPDIITQV